MCSVPVEVAAHDRTLRARSWASTASASRACSALEWRSTAGGCAMWAISSDSSACTSVMSAATRGTPDAWASAMWKRMSARR